MKRVSITLILLLLPASFSFSQSRYFRVHFIQYVPEGSSSTYGECSYYEFPGADGILGTEDDRNLLIDGGRGSYVYHILIPFLESRIGVNGTLWFLALSSAGEDHYGGLWYVVDEFQVKNFYQNLRWPAGDKTGYDNLMDKLDAEGCGPNSPPGHYFEVDPGDYLSGPSCNLHPADHPSGFDPYIEDKILAAKETFDWGSDNRYALVHQFRCGESVILSGGDAPTSGPENGIMNESSEYSYSGARDDLALSDIYKVHHHGSKYSSDQDFMDQMLPSYAVVQVAYGYGEGSHSHPTKEAMARIWNTGGIVYRNDLDGTVLIKCDNLGNFDITRSRAYVNESQTPGGSNDLVEPPPAIPRNLAVTGIGDDYVSLDWDSVAGAYGYDVFRSTISDGDPGAGRDANPDCEATGIYEKVNPANVGVSNYTDSGLQIGTTYYYRVSAKKIYTKEGYQVCYERRYSNQAAGTTSGGATPSPTPYDFKTPSPSPSPSPTASCSPRPTSTPTATPTPSATPSTTPTPTPGPTLPIRDVRINEILADVPYGADVNGDGKWSSWEDEFVELVNWTGQTVNLGGCIVSDDYAERYTFPQPFFVPPGNAVVLFGGGEPDGDFGGARVVTVGVAWGLSLTNGGDTVTLRDGDYIYDSVTYGEEGGYDQSLNRDPEITGFFTFHSQVPGSGGSIYSPGTRVNGDPFDYEPSPTPTRTAPPTATPTPTVSPSPTPAPTSSPTPSLPPTPPPSASPTATPTATPSPTAGITPTPSPTVTASATPSPTSSPTPSPSPALTATPTPSPSATPAPSSTPSVRPTPTCGPSVAREKMVLQSGDYDGDGMSDIAVFRRSTGLWAVKGITEVFFGRTDDHPVAGDYDGDGTSDIAVFRPSTGLWAIRDISRTYFGETGDEGAPGDYDGDGCADIAIFRQATGLWSIMGLTRVYYGKSGDWPVPGDYEGGGNNLIGIYRPASGLWAIKGLTRFYFGNGEDWPVSGDYNGDTVREAGIFRPSCGLWAVRGLTRVYFGDCTVWPRTADFSGDGTDGVGIFRPHTGLWALRGITRTYFGNSLDMPVTR